MNSPIFNLPSDVLERIVCILDQQCDDAGYRAVLSICMQVSTRWYHEFKPYLWASLNIKRTTHFKMAEFLPVNRPLVRDLVLDMNNSSVPSFDDVPALPTQEWYGAVLMHHMFSPNSQDPLQHSGMNSNDEDITRRIMQEWYQDQYTGWSLWPPPRSVKAPIFFPNLETLDLKRIDFTRQTNGRYLRTILGGLPLLRHLTLSSVTNVCFVSHNLVLARLQSLSLSRIDNSNKDLLHLLSVRCTPHLDRVRLDSIKITRMDSLGLLDMLLEHGDKSGRCKNSFPIRHIDGLDCIRYNDDDMTVFFENLPAESLKTVSIQRGILFGDGSLTTLIKHHGHSLQVLYFSKECRFSAVALQDLVMKVPNLRLLGLRRGEACERLIHDINQRLPWACKHLERLILHDVNGVMLNRQSEVLAHLANRDSIDGCALQRGTPFQVQASVVKPIPEGLMTVREARFLESILALKRLQELRIGQWTWADEVSRATNMRLERRYSVHGAIGREQGVVRRNIDNLDGGGGYTFYGWRSIGAE
ncbi:hypothetical protein BGZ59_010218 [Podila verticillata]|nr:hypothetical protein BGZ59_010218 [Podila verticillata]KFH68869.1 hypothetical protein MVEG_05673 [Podila verticillata NRRL 6337]